MTGHFYPRFITGLALLTALGLAGCEAAGLSTPSMPSFGLGGLFDKKEPPLPGERISVLSSEGSTATAVESKEPVILPNPQNNASWTQPGGVASNSPGHLVFAGSGRPVWHEDAGAGSDSSGRVSAIPIVYDGKVFTLDRRGRVSAFSMGGGELWHTSVAPEDEKEDSGYGGGLAADNGKIFVATGFGSVTALSANGGKPLWTKKLGVPIRTSPTAANGKVFVANVESQLFALAGEDGKELWTSRGLPEGAEILSNVSPALAGNTLVVSYPSGEVVALDVTNGQQRWSDSVSGGAVGSSAASIGDAGRPVIDGDIVFAASQSGRVIATSLKSGERVWSKDLRSDQAPCVVGDTVFVVDMTGRIFALGRKTGKTRWVATLPESRVWSGPVLASGKLWVVSDKGILVAVDAKSGQVGNKADLDNPVYIPPVVANGRMFILSDKARLIAVN
jgi:outer membrane protein assembly factor BamB